MALGDIIKPKNGGSIVDQAKKLKNDKKTQLVSKVATDVSEVIKKMIWEADLEVADYNAVMEGVNRACANWFNEQINNRPMQDVIDDPAPSTEGDK